MTSPTANAPARSFTLLVPVPIVLGCFLWAFWSTLGELTHVWKTNDQYSHGYLVPGFALVLLWLRRDRLAGQTARPNLLVGGLLLALGVGLRLAGVYWYYLWLDTVSILPCVAGVCWLFGRW